MIPKISITIPKDSKSITVADITGNYPADPTGYEIASYLPQNNVSWNKQLYVQYLGDTAQKLTFFPATTNEDVTATISYQFKDGIYLVTEYFTISVAGTDLDYALDTPKTTLTRGAGAPWTGTTGLFEGVYGVIVSASENFSIDNVSVITALAATTVTLASTLTGGTDDGPLWFVYRVQKYVLVTNDGEADLISDIGDMAINSLKNGQGCDNETSLALFNRLLLKFAAQISMNCGNYAKAHNAAVLLSASSTSSPTCTTC